MSISGDHDYAPTHTVYVQGTPGHRTDCRLDVPLRVQPLPSPEAEPSPELIAEWEADELSDRLAEETATIFCSSSCSSR